MPLDFSRNGTFMALRKLHQNVFAWRRCMAAQAERYAAVMDVPPEQAGAILQPKMAGRWQDGVPLMAAPTFEAWQAFREKRGCGGEGRRHARRWPRCERALVDFTFGKDSVGADLSLRRPYPPRQHARHARPAADRAAIRRSSTARC